MTTHKYIQRLSAIHQRCSNGGATDIIDFVISRSEAFFVCFSLGLNEVDQLD